MSESGSRGRKISESRKSEDFEHHCRPHVVGVRVRYQQANHKKRLHSARMHARRRIVAKHVRVGIFSRIDSGDRNELDLCEVKANTRYNKKL